MSPAMQVALLRTLRYGEVHKVGDEHTSRRVDVRIVAACNDDLREMVRAGTFREDMYSRLRVVQISVPPLRERLEDLPLLVDYFLQKNNEQYRKSVQALSASTMNVFMQYSWPGNVRELENMVRRMVVLGNEQAVLEEIALRGNADSREQAAAGGLDLEALGVDFANGGSIDLKAISRRAAQVAEKRVIERVLQQTRWNRKEAAERLQISYKALLYKMKENGLSEGR